MSSLYEYYNTGDDNTYSTTTFWRCQTFTPSEAHKITSVKLLLYKDASLTGTITVSIKTTDGDGKPTGEDLCSGAFDGSTLTADTDGEWKEITLGAGYNLNATTKYAIVLKNSDSVNDVWWRRDSSSPTYAGGESGYSSNEGVAWVIVSSSDMMFEDWGDALATNVTIEPPLISVSSEGKVPTLSLDRIFSAPEVHIGERREGCE